MSKIMLNLMNNCKIVIQLWTLLELGNCCSQMTHIEIGERARQFLDIDSQGVNYGELIDRHPDAYQAGCPYPDAYYPGICFDGDYHDVSEDTHWTPFMNATINYIRNTYPKPWNQTTEKLVVFLMGIIQHQVADVNWHSLGIEQGFLRTMGMVNYHGSFGDAHSDGDFGGDVVNLYELNMDYIPLVGEWYIPVSDLLNIYTELYGQPDRMTAEVVVDCTNLLFLGRLGENLGVIEYLYPTYAEASTFLIDRLHDFFLGGIDDMAVWSANIYQHAVTMLDDGTDACSLPENPIYIECNEITNYHRKGRHRRAIYSKKNANNYEKINQKAKADWLLTSASVVHPDDYDVEESDGAVIFKTTKSYQKRVHKRQLKQKMLQKYHQKMRNFTAPDVFYSTNLPYSRLGESLVTGDVNNDGYLDLVIAAPAYGSPGNYQQGRVYIIYGDLEGLPKTNLTVENDAHLILDGPALNGRFGTAMAVLDINADGYNDLVVSAPTVGSDTHDYFGQIYFYFGTISGLSATPGGTMTCSERYCNLGWSLSTGDVNQDGWQDLLIGAPFAPSGGEQRGFVGVFYTSFLFTGGPLTEDNLDWRWDGEQDYEWFGYSATTTSSSPDAGTLTVGAPTFRLCAIPDCTYSDNDIQSVGKVYTFTTPLSVEDPSITEGNISLAQLGYTVMGHSEGGKQLLAVAATTKDFNLNEVPEVNASVPILQLGYVSIYDNGISTDPFFSVVGDREFGRIGATVQFVDVNDDAQTDVIISAPLRSESVAEGREEGRVYIFLTDEAMRGELLMASQADVSLGYGEEKARYGYSVAPVRASSGQVQIAASAPHSNTGGRLSGIVTVHHL